jgi:hypothetical protein
MVKMATGDNAAAIANFTQAIALSGDEDPWVEGLLGDAEARNGDHAGAEHALDQLRKRSVTHYVPPISRGLVLCPRRPGPRRLARRFGVSSLAGTY